MHHKGGMRWRRPRRCLRVELLDVAPGGKGDGVAGVREITEEGEGGRVRATERSEWRGHKRVACSFYSGTVSLDLAVDVVADAVRFGTSENIEGNAVLVNW